MSDESVLEARVDVNLSDSDKEVMGLTARVETLLRTLQGTVLQANKLEDALVGAFDNFKSAQGPEQQAAAIAKLTKEYQQLLGVMARFGTTSRLPSSADITRGVGEAAATYTLRQRQAAPDALAARVRLGELAATRQEMMGSQKAVEDQMRLLQERMATQAMKAATENIAARLAQQSFAAQRLRQTTTPDMLGLRDMRAGVSDARLKANFGSTEMIDAHLRKAEADAARFQKENSERILAVTTRRRDRLRDRMAAEEENDRLQEARDRRYQAQLKEEERANSQEAIEARARARAYGRGRLAGRNYGTMAARDAYNDDRNDRQWGNETFVQARRALDSRREAETIRRASMSEPDYRFEKRWEALNAGGGADLMAIQAKVLVGYQALSMAMNTARALSSFVVQLDKEFHQFQAITATTSLEMVQVKKDLIAVSEATKFTALEVAQAATIMGQAGLSAKDVRASIEAVTLLATASGSTLNEAVETVTSTLSIFNLQASESAQIANTMTAALNGSKLSMDKITVGMQYAGNTAAQFGVTYQELTAVLGAMANSGIKSGSTLGTGLRALMVDLVQPSKKFQEQLSAIGLSVSDVDIRSKGLVQVMETLKGAGFGVSEAYGSFEVRAAAAYAALSNNLDLVPQLERSFQNSTAALKANQIQMESLANAWSKFVSVAGTTTYKAFEPLLAVLTKVLDLASGVVSALGKIPALPQLLGAGATMVGTALAVKTGSAVTRGIGKAVFGMGAAAEVAEVGSVAAVAASKFGFLSKAIGAVSLAFRANPFGIALTALTTLGSLVYAFTERTTASAKALEMLETRTNTLKQAVDASNQKLSALDQTISNLRDRQEALNSDPLERKLKIGEVIGQFKELNGTVDSSTASIQDLINALDKLKNVELRQQAADLTALAATERAKAAQLSRERESLKPKAGSVQDLAEAAAAAQGRSSRWQRASEEEAAFARSNSVSDLNALVMAGARKLGFKDSQGLAFEDLLGPLMQGIYDPKRASEVKDFTVNVARLKAQMGDVKTRLSISNDPSEKGKLETTLSLMGQILTLVEPIATNIELQRESEQKAGDFTLQSKEQDLKAKATDVLSKMRTSAQANVKLRRETFSNAKLGEMGAGDIRTLLAATDKMAADFDELRAAAIEQLMTQLGISVEQATSLVEDELSKGGEASVLAQAEEVKKGAEKAITLLAKGDKAAFDLARENLASRMKALTQEQSTTIPGGEAWNKASVGMAEIEAQTRALVDEFYAEALKNASEDAKQDLAIERAKALRDLDTAAADRRADEAKAVEKERADRAKAAFKANTDNIKARIKGLEQKRSTAQVGGTLWNDLTRQIADLEKQAASAVNTYYTDAMSRANEVTREQLAQEQATDLENLKTDSLVRSDEARKALKDAEEERNKIALAAVEERIAEVKQQIEDITAEMNSANGSLSLAPMKAALAGLFAKLNGLTQEAAALTPQEFGTGGDAGITAGSTNTIARLLASENGGRWKSTRNAAGAFGRAQFMPGTFAEGKIALNLPKNYSSTDFENDPVTQKRMEQWLFWRALKYIRKHHPIGPSGPEVFVDPRTKKSVTMDEGAMFMVAHLGGLGGLSRFMATKGQYNPGDHKGGGGSYLFDYARKGSGSTPDIAGFYGAPAPKAVTDTKEFIDKVNKDVEKASVEEARAAAQRVADQLLKSSSDQIANILASAKLKSPPEIQAAIDEVRKLSAKSLADQLKQFDIINADAIKKGDLNIKAQRQALIDKANQERNQVVDQLLGEYNAALDRAVETPLQAARAKLEEARRPENAGKFTGPQLDQMEADVRRLEQAGEVNKLTSAQEKLKQVTEELRLATEKYGEKSQEATYWLEKVREAEEAVTQARLASGQVLQNTPDQTPLDLAQGDFVQSSSFYDASTGKIKTAAVQTREAWGEVLGTLNSGFEGFFMSIGDGFSSIGDSVKSFGLSIIKMLQQMIAKALAFQTVMALTKGLKGTQAGGWLSSFLGMAATVPGMAVGGYVNRGTSGRDSTIRKLEPGEMVMRKSAVDVLGVDTLTHYNNLGNRVQNPANKKLELPEQQKQESTVNVWVVTPDQQPQMTERDIIATVENNIANRGSLKQLIKTVSVGAI